MKIKEKFQVCPNCKVYHHDGRMTQCSVCGFEYEYEIEDEELTKVKLQTLDLLNKFK